MANPLQASIPSLTLKGQVEYAGINGNPRYAGLPLSMKLGPRFGFAYSMNPKTVFRGGYGVFWIPQSFSAQSAAGYSQVTSLTSSINGGYTPFATLANPYPNGLTPIAGNSLGGLANIGNSITTTENGNRSAGYVEQMSLDVQRQVTKNIAVWGGYIGSHTLDQPFTVALNQLNPGYFSLGSAGLNKSVANPFFGYAPNTVSLGSAATVTQATLLTAYPEYTSVSLLTDMGRATYYSFYGKGQWRAKYGLTLNATYTWSRNMGAQRRTLRRTTSPTSFRRVGRGRRRIRRTAIRCPYLTHFQSARVRRCSATARRPWNSCSGAGRSMGSS